MGATNFALPAPSEVRVGDDGPQRLVRDSEQDADDGPAVREGDVRALAWPGAHDVEMRRGHDVARAGVQPLPHGVTMAGRAVSFPTQVAGRVFEGCENPSGCARVAPGGIGLPMTERVLRHVDAAPAFKHVSGE